MAEFDYDLITIGAGSGGVRASRLAAQTGARVAVVEEDREGGTCVLRGCVPKKLFVTASHFVEEMEIARGFGWTVPNAHHDWPGFRNKVQDELTRLSGIYKRNLKAAGAESISDRAEITGPNTVRLTRSGKEISAKTILIATGSTPYLPEKVDGIEHAKTSDDMFLLDKLPKRLTVVGGGYIAVEFACLMKNFGVDVTLIYRGAQILRGFDLDMRTNLHKEMVRKGIKIETEMDIKCIMKEGDELLLVMKNEAELRTDMVLYATGRAPYTKALGLESAGIKTTDAGAIKVDQHFKTSCDSIYAIGDVIDGGMNLTPVAIREGICFVETVFKNNPSTMDYDCIPTAVFSQPPIGTVGLTDAEVLERQIPVDIYKAYFRGMKDSFAGRDEHMLMKLIVEQETQKVLGAHIMGADAPEMIQMLGIAIKKGVTKQELDATVAVHPTAAEELVTIKEKYVPEADSRE